MSISTEITRITKARNTIRTKLSSMGLADATHTIDDLADDIEGIVYQGAVQATVLEGATYTIPAGYHNGSGTVTGLTNVEGDYERYKLQQKSITPTKDTISVKPDEGFYGLSSVSIGAIPVAYQDVTSVTAGASDVLAGKTIVEADGTVTAGTMADNGAVIANLNTAKTEYQIPEGYHNGKGTVSINVQSKEVTPTKSPQTVSPDTNRVLSSVKVNPIPADYILTNIDSDVAAAAANILDGKQAYVNRELVEGTMPNNGNFEATLNTTKTEVAIPLGYHDGQGRVGIVLETKTVTPSESSQTIIPSDTKVLSKVTVNAIPSDYIKTIDANATDENILLGKTAYVNGVKVTGTMPNNGSTSGTINGMSSTTFNIPAGYTTGGTVSLTNDIEVALAAI